MREWSIPSVTQPISSDCCLFGTGIWKKWKWRQKENVWVQYPASKVQQVTRCHHHLPLMIWTFRKQRTVSGVILLPQQRWALHERPRLPSLIPTILSCTPLGWWITADMSGIEMIRVMSSTRLLTRIYEKVLHTQPVYKCTWIFWVGTCTILLGVQKSEKYGRIEPFTVLVDCSCRLSTTW